MARARYRKTPVNPSTTPKIAVISSEYTLITKLQNENTAKWISLRPHIATFLLKNIKLFIWFDYCRAHIIMTPTFARRDG